MKTKTDLIGDWMAKAQKDLKAAEHELTFIDPITESICSHCQQAVEKYLKAYLLHLDLAFTKTHEIGELISKCESCDSALAVFKDEADKLTDYAVNVRYPEELFTPSIAEAKNAFLTAHKIIQYLTLKIVIN